MCNTRKVHQISLMIVENLEKREYSVFLATDPTNIKTNRSLKDAIIDLFLSIKYSNRETSNRA